MQSLAYIINVTEYEKQDKRMKNDPSSNLLSGDFFVAVGSRCESGTVSQQP